MGCSYSLQANHCNAKQAAREVLGQKNRGERERGSEELDETYYQKEFKHLKSCNKKF